MRRTLPLLVTATLLFAACASDDDTASDTSTEETAASDESSDTVDDPATPSDSVDDPADTSDSVDDPADTSDTGSVPPPATNPDKPEVEIPDEIPTELVVTVVEAGTGPAAESGDTVIVDYVGVRTRDGVEFDNSYDRFQAFPVALGQGGVIPGWDQGLVGVQNGARIRLDIPSELAYGERSQGEIIGENEALTFLIDVRAVVAPADPSDEPTEPGVEPSEGATGITQVVLREGDGDTLEPGQFAIIRFVLFRADNGVVLQSGWSEQPQPLPYTDDLFPPLYEGLDGMQVGERRAITFPPEYPDFGFGPEGDPTNGLPAGTDIVIVVDLVGVYGEPTG